MATSGPVTSQLPGSRPMPIVGRHGNFAQFLRDPIHYMQASYEAYGPLSALVDHDRRHVLAVGPEYNRQILSDSSLFYTVFDTMMPERLKRRQKAFGLLQMNGEQHKQQRRLMMPAFHRKRIELYRDDMITLTETMLEQWWPGRQIDLSHEMQQLTLRVASKTLFGLDTSDRSVEMGHLIKRWLDTPFFAPEVIFFPFDVPGAPFRRAVRIAEQLSAELLHMIQCKRAMLHQSLDEQYDVLTMLIQARDEDGGMLTDQELLGQATTLLIAGHETTANTLTWCLLLLAQHPHVLAELLDEITGVLGGAAPSVEQLNALPLLEGVIKESLRLLPTVALGTRMSTAPFQIGRYHLPKGAFVSFSQHLTHRLPDLYPEPLKFKPERWAAIDPSPYEYIPFGGGPRMCIGAVFAMMQLKIVLAMLLQRYKLGIAPGTRVDWQLGMTLGPKGALPMTVMAHSHRFSKSPILGTIHEMVDLG